MKTEEVWSKFLSKIKSKVLMLSANAAGTASSYVWGNAGIDSVALGDITAGHDVHHRVSMNKAKTESDFYDLAYDEDNLATLCQYHHSLLHSKYKGKTVEELITILKEKLEENE